ncbi:UDP-N-acetylmuramate dehydrogenase [bacterium]|nr:MAG: UDP-N-acetylmuramate dehydrogenase [bacterium]
MNIQKNVNLQPYLTLQTIAYADYFSTFQNISELIELLNFAKSQDLQVFFLGEGANTFCKSNFQGIVLKNDTKGVSIIRETNEYIYFQVASGENWHDFVMHTVSKNLFGLENLAFIPGSIGASPIQNINAYGFQMSDICTDVQVLDLETFEESTLENEDCKFKYRSSIFKNEARNKYFIASVTFKLSKINHINIDYGNTYGSVKQVLLEAGKDLSKLTSLDIAESIIRLRTKKLPDLNLTPNAGSIFVNVFCDKNEKERIETIEAKLREENPSLSKCEFYTENDNLYKIPAGWLVEAAGYKGKWFGNVGVSEKHALILVTNGKATGLELYDLVEKIQNSVYEMFGIRLEAEQNII